MALTRAEIQRRYRDRQRGGPARELEPCGTLAAWRRHQRRGEEPCRACKAERARYHANLARPA